MERDEKTQAERQKAGELGKKAGKFVRNAAPRARRLIDEGRPRIEKAVQDARPRLEKAVQDYRPKVEQAGREAVRYAQEHQDEIKGLAIRGARMRMGPLGMAIDALGLANGDPSQPSAQAKTCAACRAANTPGAKFCSECGAGLDDTSNKTPS